MLLLGVALVFSEHHLHLVLRGFLEHILRGGLAGSTSSSGALVRVQPAVCFLDGALVAAHGQQSFAAGFPEFVEPVGLAQVVGGQRKQGLGPGVPEGAITESCVLAERRKVAYPAGDL